MKNVGNIFVLSLAVVFCFALSSCGTSACNRVDCGRNGTCDEADGKCACNVGYEIDPACGKCDMKANAKFIGQWTSAETCPPASDPTPYTITISAVTNDLSKVQIANFGRTNCGADPLGVIATIDGTTLKSFTTTCPTVSVSAGSCSLSPDGLTLHVVYTLTDGGGTVYSCAAAMLK